MCVAVCVRLCVSVCVCVFLCVSVCVSGWPRPLELFSTIDGGFIICFCCPHGIPPMKVIIFVALIRQLHKKPIGFWGVAKPGFVRLTPCVSVSSVCVSVSLSVSVCVCVCVCVCV